MINKASNSQQQSNRARTITATQKISFANNKDGNQFKQQQTALQWSNSNHSNPKTCLQTMTTVSKMATTNSNATEQEQQQELKKLLAESNDSKGLLQATTTNNNVAT